MHIKRTSILTKMVLAVLLVYAVVSLVALRGKIKRAELQKAELQQQIADLTAQNDNIQYNIEHSEDDDVIRDIARDKLNLVEPGEEVFYAG